MTETGRAFVLALFESTVSVIGPMLLVGVADGAAASMPLAGTDALLGVEAITLSNEGKGTSERVLGNVISIRP
jgi:hypothetical protein